MQSLPNTLGKLVMKSMEIVGRQFWGKLATQHRGLCVRSNILRKMENDVQGGFTIFYAFWSCFVDLDRFLWIVVIIL